MLGIGWSELLVIALVSVLLVKPSELPAIAKKLGRLWGRLRSLEAQLGTELSDLENHVQGKAVDHDRFHGMDSHHPRGSPALRRSRNSANRPVAGKGKSRVRKGRSGRRGEAEAFTSRPG